jgi:uncharacterized membrane protein
MEQFEKELFIWTLILLAITFVLAFFMTGFIAGLGGWMPTPIMVLYLAAVYFLNPPVAIIWVIGIILIFYRELKRHKKRDHTYKST